MVNLRYYTIQTIEKADLPARLKQIYAYMQAQICSEATTGFEPVVRILQTLALPLGHVAVVSFIKPLDKRLLIVALQSAIYSPQSTIFNPESGRWDSNPRPSPWQGDVLPLNYARDPACILVESAESQNRTDDTAIFSRVLYQLSYLGLNKKTHLLKCAVILHV